MILEKYDSSTIKEFAQIALDNELYVEGPQMRKTGRKQLSSGPQMRKTGLKQLSSRPQICCAYRKNVIMNCKFYMDRNTIQCLTVSMASARYL